MAGKLSSSLLMLAILSLLGWLMYLALPRGNVSVAVVQTLIAAAFIGSVALLHKLPVEWSNVLGKTLPSNFANSRWPFRLVVLLVPALSLLVFASVLPTYIQHTRLVSFVSKSDPSDDSEYLISRLDSFKREFGRVRGLENMRAKFIESRDEGFRRILLNRAAFVACVQGNFPQASEFVTSGLRWYPEDNELLAVGGLIAFEQGLYRNALKSFEQATQAGGSHLRIGNNFQATMLGNEGLTRWEIGQVSEAEKNLARAVDLFRKSNAAREESYLLLDQGELYTDYWQLANASAKTDRAFELAGRIETSVEESRNQQANVFRQRAEIALLQGPLEVARREVAEAIKVHRETRGLQYLAQDYEVEAAIQAQAGLDDNALNLLRQAADIYQEAKSNKDLSENRLQQAKLLLEQEKYPDAQELIQNASEEFYRIGYKRGVGEAKALEGELFRQRATSRDLSQGNPRLVIDETRKAFNLYQTAHDIFQESGYMRGGADTNNLLGLAVIQINKPIGGEPLSDEAFERARHYFDRAAELYRQIGDKRGEANVYGNFGVLYRTRKDYDSAVEWLNKAYRIHEEVGFELGMTRQFINIGRVYCEKRDREQAMTYLNRARETLAGIEGGYKERKAVDVLNEICR